MERNREKYKQTGDTDNCITGAVEVHKYSEMKKKIKWIHVAASAAPLYVFGQINFWLCVVHALCMVFVHEPWHRIRISIYFHMQNINNIVSLDDNKRKIKNIYTQTCMHIEAYRKKNALPISIIGAGYRCLKEMKGVYAYMMHVYTMQTTQQQQHHHRIIDTEWCCCWIFIGVKIKNRSRNFCQTLKCQMEWEMSLKCIP